MTDQQKIKAVLAHLEIQLSKSIVKSGNINKSIEHDYMKRRYSTLKGEGQYVFFSPKTNIFYKIGMSMFNNLRMVRSRIEKGR